MLFNHHIRAMTLVEIMITIVILMLGLTICFEALTTTKRYEVMGQLQDELEDDATAVLRQASSDLATSGWHFPANEDANGNGVLDASEDTNGNGILDDADYTLPALDRSQLYYPYLMAMTTAATGHAFPTRQVIDPAVYGPLNRSNSLVTMTPWRPALYPGWSSSNIATYRTALVARARSQRILLPDDLATEMVQPSNELVFLRVATGPWQADPGRAERQIASDMLFFPSYGRDAGNNLVAPTGAHASPWRVSDNYTNLPHDQAGRNAVFNSSSYEDDGAGGYVHRNSVLATSDPLYQQPYGAQAWGAYLDDAASGPVLRLQWETVTADRMYRDRTDGQDDFTPPNDLRDFIYAVVPSPRGTGRLVRAHAVLAAGTPVLGIETGEWITDPTRPRGYAIDKILSDDVVRAVWTTRRHDATLPANQVRLRLVMAHLSRGISDGFRQLQWRVVNHVFTLRARNESADQEESQSRIDIPALANNLPFTF